MVKLTRRHAALTVGLLGVGLLIFSTIYGIQTLNLIDGSSSSRLDVRPYDLSGWALLLLLPIILRRYRLGLILFLLSLPLLALYISIFYG